MQCLRYATWCPKAAKVIEEHRGAEYGSGVMEHWSLLNFLSVNPSLDRERREAGWGKSSIRPLSAAGLISRLDGWSWKCRGISMQRASGTWKLRKRGEAEILIWECLIDLDRCGMWLKYWWKIIPMAHTDALKTVQTRVYGEIQSVNMERVEFTYLGPVHGFCI